MGIFGWLALVVVVLVLVWSFSPAGRRLIKSLWNASEGAANAGAEAVNAANSVRILQNMVDNAAESGRKASTAIDSGAATRRSLQRQINDNLRDQARLTNLIQAAVDLNDPNNTVDGYAIQLARVEEELAKNQEQKRNVDIQYENNVKMVNKFQSEVEEARADAKKLGAELVQSQAQKELAQLSASLKDKLNMGELSEARQRIKNQIDANMGSVDAATDLSRQGSAEEADQELVRKASAAAVLSRFKKGGVPAANAAPLSTASV